uniref:Uncharacterized protein n=1 Tax=Plectus sambesii TaxID=2011161 RepID=A0A914V397_9BILA
MHRLTRAKKEACLLAAWDGRADHTTLSDEGNNRTNVTAENSPPPSPDYTIAPRWPTDRPTGANRFSAQVYSHSQPLPLSLSPRPYSLLLANSADHEVEHVSRRRRLADDGGGGGGLPGDRRLQGSQLEARAWERPPEAAICAGHALRSAARNSRPSRLFRPTAGKPLSINDGSRLGQLKTVEKASKQRTTATTRRRPDLQPDRRRGSRVITTILTTTTTRHPHQVVPNRPSKKKRTGT